MVLNRAKDYYENNKDLLRERAKNKYRELFDEEKYMKREYGKKTDMITCLRKRKKRLKEDHKNYRGAKTNISQMQICQ